MDTKTLINKGFLLKQQISVLNEQLHEINKKIAEIADYKEGSKTGHINTPDLKVKVSLRENVKWHQDKLAQVKAHFGNKFDEVVKVEFKPDTKKIAKADDEMQKAFNWAKEVTLGTPSVTYELIVEETEEA